MVCSIDVITWIVYQMSLWSVWDTMWHINVINHVRRYEVVLSHAISLIFDIILHASLHRHIIGSKLDVFLNDPPPENTNQEE